MSVPDIQTRELLYEDKCVTQLRAPPLGGGYGDDCLIVSNEEMGARRAMLRSLTSWGRRTVSTNFSSFSGTSSASMIFATCSRTLGRASTRWIKALAETIKNVTTRDQTLCEHANEALDAVIAKRFGSVERFRADVLAPYENATILVRGKQYIGGKADFTAKYKWVKADADEPASKSVQLPMWVLQNGGGQATAYMIHDPVIMVDRESAKDIPCVKGCTFD